MKTLLVPAAATLVIPGPQCLSTEVIEAHRARTAHKLCDLSEFLPQLLRAVRRHRHSYEFISRGCQHFFFVSNHDRSTGQPICWRKFMPKYWEVRWHTGDQFLNWVLPFFVVAIFGRRNHPLNFLGNDLVIESSGRGLQFGTALKIFTQLPAPI